MSGDFGLHVENKIKKLTILILFGWTVTITSSDFFRKGDHTILNMKPEGLFEGPFGRESN